MPLYTFFGATGGCALATLTQTLNAGFDAVAFVRSSEKLQKLLAGKDVSESTIASHLTIIEGDATKVDSVKKALVYPTDSNRLTDVIISGIGSLPKLQASIVQPVGLITPNICENAANTLVTAIKELQASGATGKPFICAISTTGLSSRRDVPLAFVPMYHWLLSAPHADKKKMEEAFENAATQGPVKGVVIVKPSLLMDSKGKGLSNVRVGWEGGKAQGHDVAIGYTITRDDVGQWIFEEVIKNQSREEWTGRKVSLTS